MMATHIRDNTHHVLEQSCPAVASALMGRPATSVLVLVENVEHAEVLANRLPGWSLCAKDAASPGPTLTGRVIATWEGAKDLDVSEWDVVIRADGGMGLTPLLDAEAIVFGKNNIATNRAPDPIDNYMGQTEHRLLLIDFDDKHHPLLRKWSRNRWSAYAEKGWFGLGVDPVEARVERFLSSRPGV
jgi:hypothetical protein